MKHTKDGKNLNALLRRAMLGVLDIMLFAMANCSICYLTMSGHIMATDYKYMIFNYLHFGLTSVLLVGINSAFGLYRSVWYFAGSDEIVKSFLGALVNAVQLFLCDRFLFAKLLHTKGYLPYYAYILFFVLMFVATLIPRIGYRILRRYVHNLVGRRNGQKRIMIVGAGFMGNFIIDELRNDHYREGRPVIALDDNPAKYKKRINGVKIVGICDDLPRLTEKYKIDEIIFCIPSAAPARRRDLVNLAMGTKANVKISPSVQEFWENGNGAQRIRNVEISDLLSRPEVTLDKKICRYLIGKTILVTGGGGSIGSEICMQVARYNPDKIVIFDIYENCAYELETELRNKYGAEAPVITLIGSIRDKARLDEVFETYHPSVVFHAAAHKHVPLMEISPAEAVKNNVFGTKNLLTSAAEHGVERFVQLSTDKAVNPTNVMGCTKRLCEMLIQSFASGTDMKCVAVRFGNVLGSHGSVIPLFEEQIKRGGPVTITHPDIVRYFMTITEAAQLVLQAGGLAKGGSIYVLDMGEPVKIMDLATRLIRFYGYEPGVNMQVKITGLRPGEKLYEELLMDAEQDKMLKTAHNKIFIAPPMDIDLEKFYTQLQELKVSAHHNDDAVVECLQEMVPSYHPNRRVRADHTVVAASGNTMILSREELDKARKLHGAKGE